MKESYLTKTNYLNHHSLRLLVGNILLTLPSLCAVLIVLMWNIDLLWIPPLLGIIGWVLVLPITYTIARNSKERVAIDAISFGLLMLCLCSTTISIKYMLLSKELKVPIYFDQGGILTKKFGIHHAPVEVSQENFKLRIEEVCLYSKEKKVKERDLP